MRVQHLVEWVQATSNVLRPENQNDYTGIKDILVTLAYDSGAHLIESNPRCGDDVLRVASNVIGECSAKKCRFRCKENGKRPNQKASKCKKNSYWKTKTRTIECVTR